MAQKNVNRSFSGNERTFRSLQLIFADATKERGLMLAVFLNGAKGTPRARILDLLEMCRGVQKQIATAPLPEWEILDATRDIKIRRDSDSSVFAPLSNLNNALARYRVPLHLDVPTATAPQLRTISQHTTAEGEAAERLVRLTMEGKLHLLKQCEGCEAWFFAGRKDQLCCDGGCRHSKYEKKETFKKHRRLYMKVSYRRERIKQLTAELRKSNLLPKTRDVLQAKLRQKEIEQRDAVDMMLTR